jgi:hypothetical protein
MWPNWRGCRLRVVVWLYTESIRIEWLFESEQLRLIMHELIADKRKHILDTFELLFAATTHMLNATAPGSIRRIATFNHQTNQE